jgi:hypothetical protein
LTDGDGSNGHQRWTSIHLRARAESRRHEHRPGAATAPWRQSSLAFFQEHIAHEAGRSMTERTAQALAEL